VLLDLIQGYAVYLLPHALQAPFRKGRKRPSSKEVADSFVRVVPASFHKIYHVHTASNSLGRLPSIEINVKLKSVEDKSGARLVPEL
jgi:hypothetical protein